MGNFCSSALAILLIGNLGFLVGCASQSQSEPPAATTGQVSSSTPQPSESDAEAIALVSDNPRALPVDDVELEVIAEGLEHPWGMAWLPNGDILITERPGNLRIIRDGVLQEEAIAGVTEVADITAQQVFASRQGGFLDVAIHPRFAENQWIYFSYSHGTRNANRTRVARAKFDGDRLNDWEVVFEVAQAKRGGQHFGSRLVWLPDETLLISIGDGGNPPLQVEGILSREQAQNLDSHLGKVVRINDDGTIPADNPFVDNPEAEPEIWSYGHRNIQGMVFDPTTQKIWATEHGSRGGDELNLVEATNNYGWPEVSFSAEYSTGRPVAPVQTRDDTITPRRVWTPAIAPSGLTIYRGDRHPEWQGNLFAGGLVSNDIRRLEFNTQGEITAESRIQINQRVRDVRTGPDGYVYVLTDEDEGRLLRINPQ